MDVTNENLLRFYAEMGTEEAYPITQKFLESHSPSGAYVALANKFRKYTKDEVTNIDKDDKDEDRPFYECLKTSYKDMDSLQALWKKDKDMYIAFALLCDKKLLDEKHEKIEFKNPLLQKWHLFVSFYALEEYWWKSKTKQVSWKKASVEPQWLTKERISKDARESPFGILCGLYGCRELLLWMYEAAVLKTESHELDDIKNQINNGTLDGKTIWKYLAGSSCIYKPVVDKIYNLLAKFPDKVSSERSDA